VQTIVLGTGRPANMHLVISDASGDSAVFGYVDGNLVIHHGKQYNVVTNSLTYDKQLAIMEYWKDAGGIAKFLPGTSRAADRFVCISFLLNILPGKVSPTYISNTPQQNFKLQATMAMLSLMRSVVTPPSFANEEQPWASSSIWRTISDGTNYVVIFDSALTPATFWMKLNELNLKAGTPVKKLQLDGGKSYSGNAAKHFLDAKLFTFQDLHDLAPDPE
jgi:penicillin V acylase-like amidase (Ntn superfamily)